MRRSRSVTFSLSVLLAANAYAQTYPVKTVTMVVPLAAGGTADVMARLIAEKMSQNIGQQVVVDPRPGASGQIGVAAVVRSPPDGHTIMLTSTGPIAINPGLYGAKLPFDPVKDLAPITQAANAPLVLLIHPSLPARNVKELIALAKAKPGELLYASAGSASITNLDVVLLTSMAGINMAHVPYKGAPQAVISVASGETQLMINGLIPSLPLAKAGKVRMLGLTSLERNPAAPDVPTISEAGVRGYEADQWFGLFAPAATRKDFIAQLHAATVKALQSSEVSSWLTQQGAVPVGNTPEQFGAFVKAEIAKWTKVIQSSGAKPD